MESIVKDSMRVLKSNSILTSKQFGSLAGRYKRTEILNKRGVVDVIYCDVHKAFDTAPYKRLIELRVHYGVANPVLSWVQDFLSNQKQQIFVNGFKSKIYDLVYRVVRFRGRFVIYINFLVEKFGSKYLFLHADDLKRFNERKGKEDVDSLQKTLDKLYDWTQYFLLKFNPEKCFVMRLMSKCTRLAINNFYNMDENKLKIIKSENDVGVIFMTNTHLRSTQILK